MWFRVKVGRKVHYVEVESLTPGLRSVWVLQRRLCALGLLAQDGPLSGRANNATRRAVRRFQRRAGIAPTGDPHCPRTRLELREAVRAAQEAGALDPSCP